MGRRFPEFCIVRAACRVSVRASSSATGDDRIASYQAAINSVGVRHYVDWPFMVEVLNKWLEMNQDFVRDPVGYLASDPSPAPASATRIQDTPSQTATSATLTPGHPPIQSPPAMADNVTSPLLCDGGAPEYVGNSSLATSTTGTEPNDLDNPSPSSNDGRNVFVPIQKVWLLSWIGAFRHIPLLGGLGLGTLTSRNMSTPARSWFATPKPPTQQMPNPPATRWFKFSFLASSYKGWWDTFKESFAFESG